LFRLVSEDLGQELECADSSGLVIDGRLDLLKAALRMFPVQARCTIVTRCDAPPGSGLGASGAIDVALVALLTCARGERLAQGEIAEHAWQLEVVEAQCPGGRQDQFAAALGGFHRLSFRDPDVGVEPITLDPAFAAALARQTVLCYTGRSRVSGDTIARVMGAYERGDPRVTGALRALKDVAAGMAEALRAADLARRAEGGDRRVARSHGPARAPGAARGAAARCAAGDPGAQGVALHGRRRLSRRRRGAGVRPLEPGLAPLPALPRDVHGRAPRPPLGALSAPLARRAGRAPRRARGARRPRPGGGARRRDPAGLCRALPPLPQPG